MKGVRGVMRCATPSSNMCNTGNRVVSAVNKHLEQREVQN